MSMSPPYPHLRTTANYSQIYPQALACQTLSPTSSNSNSSNNSNEQPFTYHSGPTSSSLGAIFSSNGIVLFPIHAPYEPLLKLSHHNYTFTSSSNNNHNANHNKISPPSPSAAAAATTSNYLSFSTQKLQNKLASTHYNINNNSNHVLIWDTSGQSLQPLLARLPLSMSSSSSTTISSFIALDWNKHNETIHTCTQNVIATWDLRITDSSSSSHYSRRRPISTIITSSSSSSYNNNTNNTNVKHYNQNNTIISITSSHNKEHELACMGVNGIVHIYDDRMNHMELCHFSAHNGGGIGIQSIPLEDMTSSSSSSFETNDNSNNKQSSMNKEGQYGYITWGFEKVIISNNSKPSSSDINKKNNNTTTSNSATAATTAATTKTFKNSIKLWSMNDDTSITYDSDSYWYMTDKQSQDVINSSSTNYSCCSEIYVDNLSSVRVCPKPFQGGIVTVSTPTIYNNDKGDELNNKECQWQIDLWRLNKPSNHNKQEFENIASFRNTDDNTFGNILGVNFDGRYLIASELTLGSGLATNTSREHNTESSNPTNVPLDGKEVELTLCCLDNTGYIFSYGIPEASLLHDKYGKEANKRNNSIDNQFYFQYRNDKQTGLTLHQSNSDPELRSKDLVIGRGRGQSDADMQYDGLQFGSIENFDQLPSSIEGGYVKVQLDDDVFNNLDKDLNGEYGIATNIPIHQNRPVDTNSDLEMTAIKDETGEREISSKIDPLKAMRVPCPRLCGATFGAGKGLILFHNGGVKKMWNWFSSSSKTQGNVASFDLHKSTSIDSLGALKYFEDQESHDRPSVDESGTKIVVNRDFPRSLLGLTKMKEAAKFAQWGDENEDDDIEGSSLSIDEADSSDDDISDGSSTSDDSMGINDDLSAPIDVMQDYFGKNAGFGLPQYTASIFERKTRGRSGSSSLVGLTTESVVPTVFLTTKYDDVIMNGQTPELADLWRLGPWTYDEESDYQYQNDCIIEDSKESLTNEDIKHNNTTISGELINPRNESTGFIIRNYNKFDPSFQITFEREKKKNPMLGSIGETVINLNEPDCFVPSTFTTSIPDTQRLHLKHSRTLSQKAEDDINLLEGDTNFSPRFNKNTTYLRKMNHAREICIHNGKAAMIVKQNRKADVWNLLAEILENMVSSIGDEFDGWRGFGNGSLGRNLLQHILAYFERQGDVQMLATIVSVIGSFSKTKCEGGTSHEDGKLLLPSDIKKFDVYIEQYANMLFAWGHIDTSTELRKHLHITPATTVSDESGLAFAPSCLTCERPLNHHELQTKTCKSCNSYAFKCSVCTNSVRGLFTVCFTCGHGGHSDHIFQWFSSSDRSMCPTGCGCSCTFINTISAPTSTMENSVRSKQQEVR